ncbi:MAG: hypothetical protein C4581_12905 [Nitrospiraceae bacterium]|nr:MAG: hypothetical protein C4581_12905 [Nitrospiraceae bacterium]
MENATSKLIPFAIVALIIALLCPSVSTAQESNADRKSGGSEIIFRLEKMRDKETAEIDKYNAEIQKCIATIQTAEGIISKARQKGNTEAEQIAHNALKTAQDAKRKNEELKRTAELNRNRADAALDYVRKGGAEPEARMEQVVYENMNDLWVQNQTDLIEQRLREPNPSASEIYRSLKTKVPPPLPNRKYDELKPGDVLLMNWEMDKSLLINLGDRITTDVRSPAYHTVLFLKEVNGKKLFLDNTPGRGSHVISEDEFMRTYGKSDALVASVAQPLNQEEADRIWSAAKELIKKESAAQSSKSGNIIDQTGYGLFGNDDLVCSETSRWALVKAGRDIPETASPLKRLLGIHYGPANFFSDKYNFVITPLWQAQKKEGQK